MTFILHILRKDLRRTWWLFASWILFCGAQAWQSRAYAGIAMPGLPTPAKAVTWSVALALASLLLVIVIISALLHDDPVPDAQAFWLTRPIERSHLFLAKIAAVLLVVILPGLIAETLVMLWWRVSILDILHADGELLFLSAAALALFLAAGAVTRHGGEMLLLMGVITAAAMLVVQAIARPFTTWFFSTTLVYGFFGHAQSPPNEAALTLVIWTVVLTGFGGTSWWYYQTRRRAAAVALMSALFVGLLFGTRLLARALPVAESPEVTASWAASGATQARLLLEERVFDSDRPYDVESGQYLEPRKSVGAPVILEGLPHGDTATPSIVRAQWAIDGRSFQTLDPDDWKFHTMKGGNYRPSLDPGKSWRRDTIGLGPTGQERWPTLITLTQAQFEQYAGRPGRYTATVTFAVQHHDVLDTRTLAPLVFETGRSTRVEILGSADVDGLCQVDTRRTELDFRWPLRRPEPVDMLFRDRDGHPLRAVRRADAISNFAPSLLPVSPMGMPSPFQVRRTLVTLAPMDYDEHDRQPSMRIACADVRWSAIRTTDIGIVTRQLDIPDFILQP